MQVNNQANRHFFPDQALKFVAVIGIASQILFVASPGQAQTPMTVCGAETGRVYLRTQPHNSSQNANRTLSNGTPVQAYEYRNGFVSVRTPNGTAGWITERYLCGESSGGSPSYICGAETGRVYLRAKPSNASQNANRTLSNGTEVITEDYSNGFVLLETMDGMRGWVTERYVCP